MPRQSGFVDSVAQSTALLLAVAAAVVYLSSPAPDLSAQGTSAGEDALYVASNGALYKFDPATLAGGAVGNLAGTTCYPGIGLAYQRLNAAPDGTLYGFITQCSTGNKHWGRLDPYMAALTPLEILNVPLSRMSPDFLPSFGAHGSVIGYRLAADNTVPVSLYAVDALSPYRERLLDANVAPSIANFGLGISIRPATGNAAIDFNGTEIFYTTNDRVYVLADHGSGNWQLSDWMFMAVYHISNNAAVTGFDSTNTYLHILDGDVTYRINVDAQQVDILQFPPDVGHVVSGTLRRAPWGGVRIEPHEGLTTTEAAAAATFTAVLTAPPIADVTVNFASNDTTEGTVSPSSATFTTSNWNTPQTITVTGVADSDTSNQAYRIVTSASSADGNYHNRGVIDVDITNTHVNQSPSLTPGSPSAQAGSPSATATLGAVSDLETEAGSLTVETVTVPSGLSVGSLTNTGGSITAPLAASCSTTPGNKIVTLRVTDASSASTDQNVTVGVTANTAPTLGTYDPAAIAYGGGATVTPSAPPADNVSVASVTAASASFTGSIVVDTSTGAVTVGSAMPGGTHTITVAVTDNCGATVTRTFDVTVSCPTAILAASGAGFAIGGGPGIVGVSAGNGCAWNASSPVPWIVIGTVEGLGNTTATFTVGDNRTGAARQAELTIAGKPFTVMQTTGFADATLTAGLTPITLPHLLDLRVRIDLLRQRLSMTAFSWTDSDLAAGVTPVRAIHMTELRAALAEAYTQSGRQPPAFTGEIIAGQTSVRALHVTELRAAIEALEAALSG